MARLGVDLTDVAADTGGGALPVGRYQFQATEEELKGNSKGTGEILSLTLEVIGSETGEHIGRKVWVTFNVAHENPKAQTIGQAQLKALCKAIGVENVDDTEELLWREFWADTKISIDERNRERAEIKKYLSPDDLAAPPAGKAPANRPTGGGAAARPAAPAANRPAAGQPAAPAAGAPLTWAQRQAQAAERARRGADLDDDLPF